MIPQAECAPAKVNLSLHVVGKRPDGYHELEMLVAFCDIGDRIEISTSTAFGLQITGPFAQWLDASPSNLVWRAAEVLRDHCGGEQCGSAVLRLEKNLPVASGIGGGSSDAAAAIRALRHYWKLQIDDVEIVKLALQLGADVPMCLSSRPCRVSDIGEKIEQIELPPLHLVLVNPGIPLSTASVFANKSPSNLDPPQVISHFHDTDSVVDHLRLCRNDLQQSAIELVPEIAHCLQALDKQPNIRLSRMSGSGATCFGLFPSHEAANLAQASLSQQYPEWWVHSTQTLT